ncbi:MAG TPA: VOC family protein [Nocardioides sp.]|uniref:VOC family protein n=1 Tax=Nocardioides sp. TaxID=35761 RepID=UPI002E2F0175|nr:VOC family protein [Nocardioides sp.]HEX5088172.1 VOC family protein [Nocardioides sp.]
MRLLWLEAFLDLPGDTFEQGADFWSSVTGHARGPQRGPDRQFATLVPPDGLDYLRLQRLDDGPRIHLDLHVADPAAAAAEAERLGATVAPSPFEEVAIMRSPGGFVFCFVPEGGGERPAPRAWPDGHTSYVDQVCLDVPPSRYAAEMDFWAAVTGWRRRDPSPGSEFGRLTPGADQPLQLLMQRLDDERDAVTAHLDWATSDREAEIRQHLAAGAELQKSFADWTVLRDPAGMTYCITDRTTGDRPE